MDAAERSTDNGTRLDGGSFHRSTTGASKPAAAGNGGWPFRVPVAVIRVLSHRRMRRSVETYLDGEMTRPAAAEVARHLTVCWECSILAETLRLLKGSLRQRRDITPAVAERRLRRFAEDLAGTRSGHRAGSLDSE